MSHWKQAEEAYEVKDTLDSYRSHIRCQIRTDSNNAIDICDEIKFPSFAKIHRSVLRRAKEAGKGDTKKQ